jgi:hypothetical protein
MTAGLHVGRYLADGVQPDDLYTAGDCALLRKLHAGRRMRGGADEHERDETTRETRGRRASHER